ncbi:RNA polymerase-associated protein RapA [Kushneria marisflavi]|uniref:RNA polymerase-associated protein RapA n=1 Tax=Kushneria marisflavi TaxID=157779 RepID=A0A240URJ2_9GAMM|nr:RNA polymerase-associated protein RapA [Kushneria marisflavi]ART63640.1 RNA polymerase-binding ATPase [Kushneria marisflavi]RKD85307.1 ATP-dependent helicase HepA [Kushneria marisflavi]
MSNFTPGQRFISDGETELGLGTILNCDARSVTVLFAASDETRTYSVREAPLTRVVFGRGDRIDTDDGQVLLVSELRDEGGRIIYIGQDSNGERELPESRISDRMQFHQARDRLLTGQIDRNDAFNLRYRSLQHLARVERHPGFGLSGPRIDLIPHQLHIADDIASRRLPRVLLADEVGLGKTIEAGLVLHRMLLTGRVERALILVPDSLAHQWLVELLRRFSIEVTLLDEQQSKARGNDGNPFESAQLVLASQQWLFANPERQSQAQACNWDLLIVDEAQHLEWDPENGGDTGYQCVEALATQHTGLLLLSATPEQMGDVSHFARLRLLDPERYHDIDAFRAEQRGHATLAEAIEALEHLPEQPEHRDVLHPIVADDPQALALLEQLMGAGEDKQPSLRESLRRVLLDRYGIGRVMFRNSRRHVSGFPVRHLHVSELENPGAYRRIEQRISRDEDYLDSLLIETGLDYPEILLYPEATFEARRQDTQDDERWWRLDPRMAWLREWLKSHPGEKALLICHYGETARELAAGLQVLTGLHVPVFHEDMTLIERDRAAAAFAEAEDGSPLLICSEIGSEGRNFQFCHHLILFDLPPHPDQLEQRIGRLDRIGQQHDVEIHLPIMTGSPTGALLRWYQEALAAFEAPSGLGSVVSDAHGDALFDALLDQEALDEVIEESRTLAVQTRQEREAGRDRLLAWSSFDAGHADEMIEAVQALDDDAMLDRYLDQALDVFGIDTRETDEGLTYLHPGSHMVDGMPGLIRGEEGFTATRSRQRALARDDLQRLSWEHPLVREMLSRATNESMGNTALALLAHPSIPGGRFMLEAIFRTRTSAPKALHVNRFFPPATVRVLLDESGQVLSDKVSFGGLARNLRHVKKGVARNLVRERQQQLRELFDQAEQQAEAELPALVEDARAQMAAQLEGEIDRLTALAQRNPDVRAEEIDMLRHERAALDEAIAGTRLQLDAVRVIVTVDPQ